MSGPVVLIAAGGTGGHVFPGLATAAALVAAKPDLTVEFVGTAERLEGTLVPEAGYALHTVPAMSLSRSLSPDLLRLPVVIGRSVLAARRVITSRDVIAAAGFGGYTSVPLALAARTTGTPLVVHEQNAVPGVANKLAARAATTVGVAFSAAMDGFGRRPTVMTGNPVRPGLEPAPGEEAPRRAAAAELFDLDPARRTVLVFGGSQGAKRINDAVTAADWAEPGSLQILHGAGRRTVDATRQLWRDAGHDPDGAAGPGQLKVRCVEFIDRMDLAYAIADLVICRAGASSIAELTALGIPALLVPYPHAAEDHQTVNAREVAGAGAALVIADGDLTARSLVATAGPLLADGAALDSMAAAATAFGRPDAAARLAELILSAAGLGTSAESGSR